MRKGKRQKTSGSFLNTEKGLSFPEIPLYDGRISLEPLRGKTIGVIGYGNQGRAQALNLRDSGLSILVGLRTRSLHRAEAISDGLEVLTPLELAKKADILMFLLPDDAHKEVFQSISSGLKQGQALGFAHGFTIHYGVLSPPPWLDVFLVAPKGVGAQVRKKYAEGLGVPALVAVAQDYTGNALSLALCYAKGIGCARPGAGIYPSTFQQEAEADLFTEQVLLCGGVPELVKLTYESLVQNGYPPEASYFETVQELKLLVDLLVEKGLAGMYSSISPTALYGGITRGKYLINEGVQKKIQHVLRDIQSGKFAREWLKMREKSPGMREEVLQAAHRHALTKIFQKLSRRNHP